MLWDSAAISVDIMPHGNQALHALIKVHSNPKFKDYSCLISGVYASPHYDNRRFLWDELCTVADNYDGPWCLIGDFNDVMASHEKSGGRPIDSYRVNAYSDCINHCHLFDLGFSGPKFTWGNNRFNGGLIKQRLDRAWVNDKWRALFSEAALLNLPRTSSDHSPLLLHLEALVSPNNKPFRIEKFWFDHPDFCNLVNSVWVNSLPISTCSFDFVDKAKAWSREVFGNIFAKKKEILKRLKGIQNLPVNRISFRLQMLEKSLQDYYNGLLSLERDLWFLKSRATFITDGDKNTKFFHVSALKHRARNRILSLKEDSGIWNFDPHFIQSTILTYFMNMFSTSHLHSFKDSFKDLLSLRNHVISLVWSLTFLLKWTLNPLCLICNHTRPLGLMVCILISSKFFGVLLALKFVKKLRLSLLRVLCARIGMLVSLLLSLKLITRIPLLSSGRLACVTLPIRSFPRSLLGFSSH